MPKVAYKRSRHDGNCPVIVDPETHARLRKAASEHDMKIGALGSLLINHALGKDLKKLVKAASASR